MLIDPRGPRFVASITTVVLVAVLLTGSGYLLAAQAAVFAIGAVFGITNTPYAYVFRTLLRPRLGPVSPDRLEPAAPPRFAQGVGLAFALVGALGYLTGLAGLGIAATSLALFAAFLNAAFGFCLGCEIYLILRRIRGSITIHEEASA